VSLLRGKRRSCEGRRGNNNGSTRRFLEEWLVRGVEKLHSQCRGEGSNPFTSTDEAQVNRLKVETPEVEKVTS